MYETLLVERIDNIAVIKINRPKALNAINQKVVEEMNRALEEIQKDVSVKVLIITGEGEKAFVAGADIAYMANLNPIQARAFSRAGQELLFKIESMPIPVIACVNGYALGGGTELAMACDFIYAADTARFGQPEINLGIIPGFGGTQRLSRLVGKARAKELCMTGVQITAQEAKEIGLVNKVFPKDQLWEETLKTAKVLATKGKVALRAIKRCIDRGFDVDLRDGCYLEAESFATVFSSPDAREGLTAFLEKRQPKFEGELS